MLGSSRTSMTALEESLSARFDSGISVSECDDAGRELFSVVDLLSSQRVLLATLADPAINADSKKGVVAALLAGQVGAVAQSLVVEVVTARWSSDADMVDALDASGAALLLMGAEKEGRIDRVEEELFRFGRAIDANADLQMALTNPATSSAVKAGIVHSLLDGRSAQETVTLVAHGAGSLRGRRIQAVIAELSDLAAARRGRVIADIRTAVPLTATQCSRLGAALTKLFGRRVELNVDIDPSVVGGIEVRVGDEVIDATISSKLDQARRRMTS
jgi:F-type H+-transporting ATPase subunit delta